MEADFMNKIKIENNLLMLGIDSKISNLDISLPLAYRNKYDLKKIVFLEDEKNFILIKENRKGDVEDFISQARFISNRSGLDYILIFNNMSSQEIAFLIRWRIPFIDYNGNLFLPFLTLALRETILPEIPKNEKLSRSEQLLITYLLSTKQDEEIDIEKIQQNTKLSQATLYRCIKKFTKMNWIEKIGKRILFQSKIELFEEAKKYFYFPIKELIYVRRDVFNELNDNKNQRFLLSDDYALEKNSMLVANEAIKHYAISKNNFKILFEFFDERLNSHSSIKIPDSIAIELWDYQPYHVRGEDIIDPISLYISKINTSDPRTEKEIELMVKNYLKR